MEEIWKDIPGYEGRYQASTFGRIKSLDRTIKQICRWGCEVEKTHRGKILKIDKKINNSGYHFVSLGDGPTHAVHSVVMITFVGPRPFEKAHINHKDGDKKNNRIDNLEYVSCKENLRHAQDTGLYKDRNAKFSVRVRGEGNPKARLTESQVREIYNLASEMNAKETAELYGVSKSLVHRIRQHRIWTYLNLEAT